MFEYLDAGSSLVTILQASGAGCFVVAGWAIRRWGKNREHKGFEEGQEKGIKEAIESGSDRGREIGMKIGMEKGIAEGIAQGVEEGRKQGLEEGRRLGHAKGVEEGRFEIANTVFQEIEKSGVKADRLKPGASTEQIVQSLRDAARSWATELGGGQDFKQKTAYHVGELGVIMFITSINIFGLKMTLDGQHAELSLGVPYKHEALPGYILLWAATDKFGFTARIIVKKADDRWDSGQHSGDSVDTIDPLE
ncbi:hypothetical protein HFO86_14970 [Rhizobium leguminosarum]|uniref:hypothetical protein n=1 Tax=Rhizobium leguminosarum TaxID=384 RepID=UPI001C95F730|nr:hypothetical protein [Rhizobium leguminosarum]MBY5471502.1 hypothetical protein [Rhizobium leguminosarum]